MANYRSDDQPDNLIAVISLLFCGKNLCENDDGLSDEKGKQGKMKKEKFKYVLARALTLLRGGVR